jgi:alcohol dehydrogenase class IV
VAQWIGAAFGLAAPNMATATAALAAWASDAGLPGLRALGVTDAARAAAADMAAASSSMQANPAQLSPATLNQIMQAAG